MSEREREILAFLRQAGWEKAGRVLLPQDASTRRYHRLRGARGDAILMDAPPGGDQLKST
ncbi:MAG TPA: aminoglycoside phosphotransferase, partial [Alphaproteobacteria bacterium]|nr:aminoglycoside phosphotransferase [Alphaproteobacteria bacterium]